MEGPPVAVAVESFRTRHPSSDQALALCTDAFYMYCYIPLYTILSLVSAEHICTRSLTCSLTHSLFSPSTAAAAAASAVYMALLGFFLAILIRLFKLHQQCSSGTV